MNPPALQDVLATLATRGDLDHLLLRRTPSGAMQASFRSPRTQGSFSIAQVPDPAELEKAVLQSVGPRYGHSWVPLVGSEIGAPLDACFTRWREDEEDAHSILESLL